MSTQRVMQPVSQILDASFRSRMIAPLHWKARAQNAHSSAKFLWEGRKAGMDQALWEGFQREAAVALELIIKAVVVARKQKELKSKEVVKLSHDLPMLWAAARLPALPSEDKYRLAYFKSVLLWLGRYPTPKTVAAWQKDMEERAAAELKLQGSQKLQISPRIACGWPEFDSLYRQAFDKLCQILANE